MQNVIRRLRRKAAHKCVNERCGSIELFRKYLDASVAYNQAVLDLIAQKAELLEKVVMRLASKDAERKKFGR